MDALTGRTLANRYFLRKSVRVGGMVQVYEAWDRQLITHMAIKVIHDARLLEAFVREAAVLKDLLHPNIVRLYDVQEDRREKVFFLVMDWVEGRDLRSMLQQRQLPFGVTEVLHILDGVQMALQYAHSRGLCHCDIKPSNVMLRNADNCPLLTDFGLAHANTNERPGGTLAYMAPEIIRGAHVSVATDIYALGVTLYELLSRQLPFHGRTVEDTVQLHLFATPPPLSEINPSIPSGIVRVIEKALEKDPARRQNSVAQLWEEFERYHNPGVARGRTEWAGRGSSIAEDADDVNDPSAIRATTIPLPEASPLAPRLVFISYRRSDSADISGRIYDRLVAKFGREQVFKDVDSIPLGANFKAVLDSSVGTCKVLLAVIGRNWVDATYANGKLRLRDPADFVRIEIESALNRNIPVIPLLVGGASMPTAKELPPSLREIVFRNGIPIRPDPDFHYDMTRLIRSLENIWE